MLVNQLLAGRLRTRPGRTNGARRGLDFWTYLIVNQHFILVCNIEGPQISPQQVLKRPYRMRDVCVSDALGLVPADWNLDRWMADSVGIWRDDAVPVALLIKPHAAERGRGWRYHPSQTLEELADGNLRICFRAGGQRELAEHLFT